jgi:hypothetical protein
VKRKEGAGNSVPSPSSNLSLILNRDVFPLVADSDPSPDKSHYFAIEIHSTNKSDYHAAGQFGRLEEISITFLKARR